MSKGGWPALATLAFRDDPKGPDRRSSRFVPKRRCAAAIFPRI
jgi:hypothetical protein